ncbi:protein piccolo [Pungitius pungitius]|uniref:protein piccolo n=1 Tax=Pungitius pungitius TaxID=134920 RepID=UPI002E1198D3
MKPDGDTMETTEPTDAAAVAEPSSSQGAIATEQAPSQPEEAATDAAPKANGKPAGAGPKSAATKTQPAAKSAGASGSRPGTASLRAVKPFAPPPAAALKKTAATAKVAPAAGVVPKRPAGGVAAASSTVKNQSRGPDKRPFGPARAAAAAAAAAAPATATNGSRPTANGIPKRRPGAEAVNVARAKAAVPASRAGPSAAPPKAATSAASKAPVVSVSKTARPAPGPSTSRAAFTYRATASTVKSSAAATAKTAAPRVTAAPSTGRTAAAQPPRTAAAKRDVSRPTSAVAKKPAATTKKPEPSKPTATLKLNPASKSAALEKEADPKMMPSKASQPPFTKKAAAPFWGKDRNRLPLGQTPPASPASKPAHSSTTKGKCSSKPMQAVPPFTATKNPGVSNTTKHAVEAQRASRGTVAAGRGTAAAAAAVLAAPQTEATEPLPQASSPRAAPAPEDDHLPSGLDQDASPEAVPLEPAQSRGASSSPPRSPVRTTSPQASPPLLEQLESNADSPTTRQGTRVPVEPAPAPAACPPCPSAEAAYLNQTPSTSEVAAANAITVTVPHTNLNEDNDEEEREGSQLVSVSEMSGTTQPTEDSRPDSAGPVGGSHWRAGGALLSELDSEDVSGSQQGASELSAPGVLEGTESMDDLGDGSLKGAIDMEGASAGSPDFEKVPDIPANDFDEDDEEGDRVCDMDVGSERADRPQRLRQDNNVDGEEGDVEEAQQQEDDDDDDEDVEMASEGVTESGLESYGNADEDDFAEDERLDNLNRVGDPPAPPLPPSAPAAQWHQPNPFADPWAEPLRPLQGLENSPQPAPLAGAAASPSGAAWQADPETPTRAQVWPDRGSDPLGPENPGVPHRVVKERPQSAEAGESGPAPSRALAPGASLSSTLSSDTSTPEELCDSNGDGGPQPHREEAEAEARPPSADVVRAGPASNTSSTSVTEDEASDTEGEALLDDSLESPAAAHATFECQPPAQRCLSTVEEAAEGAEGAAGFDTTPPSATSLASCGFDTMTTASNSNAQSTGESCVKSPGIFSLEELSDETKESCPIPSPPPPSVAEHNYIDCGTQQEAESAESFREEVPRPEEAPSTLQPPEESPDDAQPPYYSICEKTENSFAGFAGLPHPHRREHSAHPRSYGDAAAAAASAASALATPRLTCADLPPRSPGQQALSPQLRRLEQHQRQLLEMQQRRDQQSRPLEEAEQERRRREEEETRRKKQEAEEEIKRNEEALARRTREDSRKEEELQERQQIMQWHQELQQSNQGQTAPLSPSSGLCTIYEALEASDDEEEGEGEAISEGPLTNGGTPETGGRRDASLSTHRSTPPPPPPPDSPLTSSDPSQDGDSSSPPESPERPAPQELDWGKNVDIVQQLINQTLLLNRDGCSSLLVLPGGAGGTLSPLESSLWPSLLPPLTPPSATVTAVSSFSPEATGSSPQGEWTVVELETHH